MNALFKSLLLLCSVLLLMPGYGRVILVPLPGNLPNAQASQVDLIVQDIDIAFAISNSKDEIWLEATVEGQSKFEPDQTLILDEGTTVIGGMVGDDQGFWTPDPDRNSQIDGKDNMILFSIESPNPYNVTTLIGIEFYRGHTNSLNKAGAITAFNVQGTLHIDRCHFRNNEASYGGALLQTQGRLEIHNSTFSNNNASYSGGAAFLISVPVVEISGCTFSNNKVKGQVGPNLGGGGIAIHYSDVIQLDDCVFFNNISETTGGGCRVLGTKSVVINNTSFEGNGTKSDLGNQQFSQGGGLFLEEVENTEINYSSFQSNSAVLRGGAILNKGLSEPQLLLNGVEFERNTTEGQGSILWTTGNISGLNCLAYNNSSSNNLIFGDVGASLEFYFSIFYDSRDQGVKPLFCNWDQSIPSLHYSIIKGFQIKSPTLDWISATSCIVDDDVSGTDNIILPPDFPIAGLFRRPQYGDLRPAHNSPAVDRLDPSSIDLPQKFSAYLIDPRTLANRARRVGPASEPSRVGCDAYFDIGAFEHEPYQLPSPNFILPESIQECGVNETRIPLVSTTEVPTGMYRVFYRRCGTGTLLVSEWSWDTLGVLVDTPLPGEELCYELAWVESTMGCTTLLDGQRIVIGNNPVRHDLQCDTLEVPIEWDEEIQMGPIDFAGASDLCGIDSLFFSDTSASTFNFGFEDIGTTVNVNLEILWAGNQRDACTSQIRFVCGGVEKIEIQEDQVSACLDEPVLLRANIEDQGPFIFQWDVSLPNGSKLNFENQDQISFTPDHKGSYQVLLNASIDQKCLVQEEKTFHFAPRPEFNEIEDSSFVSYEIKSLQLKNLSSVGTLQIPPLNLSFNPESSILKLNHTGTYELFLVKDNLGCTNSLPIVVNSLKWEPKVFFSPDDDDINDSLEFPSMDLITEAGSRIRLEVYDANNNRVYSNGDYNRENLWTGDGPDGNPLPEGLYRGFVYVIDSANPELNTNLPCTIALIRNQP